MVDQTSILAETDTNQVIDIISFVNTVLQEEEIPIMFGISADQRDGIYLMYHKK